MVILSWPALVSRPLLRMSLAVSSNSLVSRLVFAFFFVFVVIMHLNQSSVIQRSGDFLFACVQERSRDFTQGEQLPIADVLALVFGEGEKIDGAIGAKSDQHTKAASFSLTWPSDSL